MDFKIETWESLSHLDILHYSISTFGNIRNDITHKTRKLMVSNDGYLKITLKTTLKSRGFFIHRLVGLTFLKDKRNDQNTVDHIDRNKLNNNVSNLRWASMKEQRANQNRLNKKIPIYIFGDMVGETWKISRAIINPLVQVSNLGRINIKNKTTYGSGNTYKSVHIGKKNYFIHRLVAEEWCDGKTKEKNMVNHKDGNKSNNQKDNLEWVTCVENAIHSVKYGRLKNKCRRVANYKDDNVIIEIFNSMSEATKKYNLCGNGICESIKKNQKAGGFYWRYI